MTHLRENFFAVLVDDDAIGTPYIEENRIRYTVSRISSSSDSTYIGQGNYKPLCVTHRIKELDAVKVVESHLYPMTNDIMGWRDYTDMDDLCGSPVQSLTSLLKSKGLDTEKNYAIIEKL